MSIIFKNQAGQICVSSVTPGIDEGAEAKRIVPHGLPYKIVDASKMPQDVPQEFWEIDDSELDSGVGA